MSAGEYYSGVPFGTPSEQPPSYHDQPRSATGPSHHLSTGSRRGSVLHSHTPSPSPYPRAEQDDPFNTMFDSDHDRRASAAFQTPGSSQYKLSQDTAYPGGPRYSNEMTYNPGADDIPLRDQLSTQENLGKDAEMRDHVYDAPLGGSGSGSGRRKRRRRLARWGELGMIGANNKKRIPWVVYLFTLAQIAVFIAEIARNAVLTGSPIETKPSFNIMIGPSPYVLINMGARFVPCMHNVDGIQSSTGLINWPCPNTTTNDASAASQQCTLSELCGFGGVPEPFYNSSATIRQSPEPNQWWRFIVPIFLHAGLIHISFNLLMQLTAGREVERSIGHIRFFVVYMSAGIFGFVMGGNFAAVALASTGASGSLFGIIALTLLDLLYSWKDRERPVRDLVSVLIEVVISFVLGLLPGLDNFSHIGGFFMGITLGLCLLHSPNSLRRRFGGNADANYADLRDGLADVKADDHPSIHKDPRGFFAGRKPLWWVWWVVRAAALVFALVVFILLLKNFYVWRKTCGWCKYLSCLPVNNWCDNNLTITTTTNNNKRDLIAHGLKRAARLFMS